MCNEVTISKEFTLVPYEGGYKLFYDRVVGGRNVWMNCKDIPWSLGYYPALDGKSARVFRDHIQDLKFWEILHLLNDGYVYRRTLGIKTPFTVHPDGEYKEIYFTEGVHGHV